MINLRFKLFVPLLFLSIFIYSCGTTSDTVEVVRESPRETQPAEQDEESEEFQQLTIGVTEPVTNFDPLFARNLSTKQILSLVYEGLFSVDKDGDVIPAIASDYEVSEDGLEYRITINREIFYHDNAVFTAGVGRRIHARDIKWAFERTAKLDVPPMASELLMNVRGYENFFLEQHTIFDPEKRVLEEVSGIRVVDAQTIRFNLYEPDPDFLDKLSSPYLFIYPRESVEQTRDGLPHNPVGTGPYEFGQETDDNSFILVRFEPDNGNRGTRPFVNRINVNHTTSETDMFRDFVSGDLDLIPEIGPQIMEQAVQSGYELQSSYRNSFQLTAHNSHRITAFYINLNSVANRDWLLNRLRNVSEDDFSSFPEITIRTDAFAESEDASPLSEYFVAFTEDPYARRLLSNLNSAHFQPESELVFFDIRVPTRRTSIYTETTDSFHQAWIPISENYWLRTDSRTVSLHQNYVSGISATSVPWKIFISNISVDESERTTE